MVSQQRLVHHELVGLLGDLAEKIDLRAYAGLQRECVDRRVGHLREQLLEVREQRRLAV